MSAPQGIARAALDALPYNITVIDGSRRLVYANPSFWRAAGIDPASCPIGSPVENLIRILCYRGLYGPGEPEEQVQAVLRIDRTRPFRRRVRSADGRTVTDIMSYPLAEGGYATCGVDVTASADAEAATQARFGAIEDALSRAQGGLVIYDSALRLSYANPAYGTLIGIPGGFPTGTPLREVLARLQARGEIGTTEQAEGIARRIEQRQGQRQSAERERPNGQVLRFLKQPTAEGGFVEEVTDITALRRAEDEARRRAAVLDGVLGTLPHGVLVYGPDRRVAMFNAAYARIMEGAPVTIGESMEVVNARRVATGEFSAEYLDGVLAKRYVMGAGQQTEILRVRPNGTAIAIRVAELPDGGHVSVVTDITALHRAEEGARDRAALLERTLGAMRHGISMFGPDHRLILTNAQTTALTNTPAEALYPGVTHQELLEGQVRRGLISPDGLAASLALDRTKPQRYVRSRADGRVMEVVSDPTPDGGFVVSFTDITALHEAEATARDRAVLLDAMIAHMPQGVCVYGPDLRVAVVNDAYNAIMGSAAAKVGEDFQALIQRRIATGEVTAERAAMVIRKQFSDHPDPDELLWRVRPNGTAITTRIRKLPNGGFLSVVTDVTALHQAEKAARDRAEMLNAVLQSLPVGVTVYGPDKRATLFNTAYSDIMGDAAVRVGESLSEVAERRQAMGEFDGAMAKRLMARHLGPAGEQATPIRRHRPNGTVVDTRAGLLPDGGHIAVTVDVTALHRAEQELQHRAAMQEAMLGSIRHGIVLYGPDRRVLATNAKTAELTGIPAALLVPGTLLDDLIDAQVLRGQITPSLAAEMKAFDRRQALRYSRSRPCGGMLEVTSDPTADGGYVITYADVTDDRRIRAELESAKLEAEGASRAKSRFLATMSHELRSPLSAVIGFAEALGRVRDPVRITEYADAIRDAGQHLLLLIDDILDVARSQGSALAVAANAVDLAPMLERAQRAAATLAGDAGLTLVAEWPAALPRLAGDARRLHQVLLNLLSNAVKFTPAGGIVTLGAAMEQGSLVIRVADTGIGIPPEHRETVFQPFTQLDDAHARHFPGSGLGLYMARSLAEAMGGTLTLETPAGPGTLALLRFPPERLLPPEPMPEGPTP